MFGQVGKTELDLHFGLFGIPVRIHPGFWLVAVLMGRGLIEQPAFLVVWVLCVFLSILVHEFGHALAAQHSGYPVEVVLYYFGGYASFVPTRGGNFGKPYTHWRSIAISFAGPLAGFVFYGLVVALRRGLWEYDVAYPRELAYAFRQLEYINLWWGLVNLVPVHPLDGGQICRELLVARIGNRGLEYTFLIGIIVGGATALVFASLEQQLSTPVLLFGVLAYSNFRNYQQCKSGPWR